MNIVDTLASYLGQPFPSPFPEVRFNCPECECRGKTPDVHGHLYLNVEKRLYFCQRCSWKGVLEYLLRRFGVTLEATVAQWGDIIRRLSFLADKDYTEPYDHTEGIEYPCEALVPKRGFSSYRYLIYPKAKQINNLQCRELSLQQVTDYQIRVGIGYWGKRIFVPTFWGDALTFWVARDFSGETDTKYLNPLGRSRRYHVFNLNRAQEYRDVVITEGVFSAIAAGPNAVATFGKFVTIEQLHQLLNANFGTYFVALDGDAKPQSLYVARWLHTRGKTVRLVPLPEEDDPDSVPDFAQCLKGSQEMGFRSEVEFLLS